jgi:E3 ubiquitin-protein ligase SHPRH
MEQLDTLAIALDAQAKMFDEWREQTIQLLLRSLVDEDEGVEITGDEYEESTKTQDEVIVYVQALRAVISDRHDALTGQENQLVAHETKTSLRLAEHEEGPFQRKHLNYSMPEQSSNLRKKWVLFAESLLSSEPYQRH